MNYLLVLTSKQPVNSVNVQSIETGNSVELVNNGLQVYCQRCPAEHGHRNMLCTPTKQCAITRQTASFDGDTEQLFHMAASAQSAQIIFLIHSTWVSIWTMRPYPEHGSPKTSIQWHGRHVPHTVLRARNFGAVHYFLLIHAIDCDNVLQRAPAPDMQWIKGGASPSRMPMLMHCASCLLVPPASAAIHRHGSVCVPDCDALPQSGWPTDAI
jgi:hypothetical protein